MSKVLWSKETYFNPHAWLLEHVKKLNLSPEEVLIVLLILHFQTHQVPIDLNKLAQYANLAPKQIDAILSQLVKRAYIKINMLQTSLSFDLSNLFAEQSFDSLDKLTQILSTFEHEFKRPLSAHEVDKVKDWLQKLDGDYLIHALREAIIYRKLNFNYIDKILITWMNQNITLDQLNDGQKNG